MSNSSWNWPRHLKNHGKPETKLGNKAKVISNRLGGVSMLYSIDVDNNEDGKRESLKWRTKNRNNVIS